MSNLQSPVLSSLLRQNVKRRWLLSLPQKKSPRKKRCPIVPVAHCPLSMPVIAHSMPISHCPLLPARGVQVAQCPHIHVSRTTRPSPLHSNPCQHAFEHRVLVEPVSLATVRGAQVAENMLVGDVVEFLHRRFLLASLFHVVLISVDHCLAGYKAHGDRHCHCGGPYPTWRSLWSMARRPLPCRCAGFSPRRS